MQKINNGIIVFLFILSSLLYAEEIKKTDMSNFIENFEKFRNISSFSNAFNEKDIKILETEIKDLKEEINLLVMAGGIFVGIFTIGATIFVAFIPYIFRNDLEKKFSTFKDDIKENFQNLESFIEKRLDSYDNELNLKLRNLENEFKIYLKEIEIELKNENEKNLKAFIEKEAPKEIRELVERITYDILLNKEIKLAFWEMVFRQFIRDYKSSKDLENSIKTLFLHIKTFELLSSPREDDIEKGLSYLGLLVKRNKYNIVFHKNLINKLKEWLVEEGHYKLLKKINDIEDLAKSKNRRYLS